MPEERPYRMDTTERDGIVEITITGRVAPGDMAEEAHLHVLAIVAETNARAYLVDLRGLAGRSGLVDVYYRIQNLPPRTARPFVALVDLKENESYASFQETAARNTGRSWRWFTDTEEAGAWLRGMIA